MVAAPTMMRRLSQVFTDRQASILTEVIQQAYSELVHTSDFNELKEIVRELAQAQQRTEQRMGELASAQQRTEIALQRLSQQVGGLSDRLGGDLEDVAYIVIHDVLERDLNWRVDTLERDWLRWDGHEVELDLFGRGHDPQRAEAEIWIVGEVKFNLTLKEAERFARKVEFARAHLQGEVFPVCFCYRARPEVKQRLQELGLRLVFSYGRLV